MKTLPLLRSSSGYRRFAPRGVALLAGWLAALVLTPPAARAQVAANLQNLAAFGSANNGGENPNGPLVQGSDGNFYGVTEYGGTSGGTYGRGTVFKVTPAGAVTTLYTFSGGSDGGAPVGGLVIGRDGNFYGATYGLSGVPEGPLLNGTIFQLTPAGVLTTLHHFTDTAADGLVQGKDGNFYGVAPVANAGDPGPVQPGAVSPRKGAVTSGDGTDTGGIFFRITPTGVFTTLYNFSNDNNQNPIGKLLLGNNGNFYGVALETPANGGTIFQITPDGSTLTTVFLFNSEDGTPNDGLVQDQAGNLYGTTFTEGSSGSLVFQIDPTGAMTTLHTFNGNDGEAVRTGLTLGSDGNLYGVASQGGVNSNNNTSTTPGYGTIFQITPAGVLTTLHNFDGEDGASPNGPLLQAGNGLFHGTTADSQANDTDGYFFALTVSNRPAFFTGELALTEGVYYLQFPNTDFFGYYTFLSDPNYLYHFDLGYEYVFDAKDGEDGVYLYDFASGGFFYTSPTFPFPYLYDFTLNTVLYYYPINFAGRYSSDPRYFYDFSSDRIITK